MGEDGRREGGKIGRGEGIPERDRGARRRGD